MDYVTADELEEARKPIESLISKSEKAQTKVAPGTWQHTMLGDNIAALHIASALMYGEAIARNRFTQDALNKALGAFASMIDKTEKSQAKFAAGTSQYSLQKNRLKALRIGEAVVRGNLDGNGQ